VRETSFHKNQAYRDGYYAQCIECRKAHPSQTPEKVMQRVLKQRKRNRAYVLEYLKTHHCDECGEDRPECLDFHHTNRITKLDRVSKLVHNTRSLKVIQAEMDKCVILCANCHRVETARQQGWYASGYVERLGPWQASFTADEIDAAA
jgi:5-methylcytosine-specific restriction endonuclease McrA